LSGAVLRDALPADPPLLARFAGADGRPPNVVVYVIDTLRADHVGCYGYRRPTTPRIDEFARSAVRFGRAVAQSSWTLPAVASILTGLYPLHHGAIDPDHAIRPDVATLAGVLAARGWTTAGFVTNYLGSDVYGLGRGFQTYRFYREQGARRRAVYLRSDAVLRRVEHWLERGPWNPFLLYVHVTDPHFPYVPPPRSVRPFWTGPPSPAEIDTLTDRVRMLHNGQADWGTRPAPVSPHDIALLGDLYDGEIRFARPRSPRCGRAALAGPPGARDEHRGVYDDPPGTVPPAGGGGRLVEGHPRLRRPAGEPRAPVRHPDGPRRIARRRRDGAAPTGVRARPAAGGRRAPAARARGARQRPARPSPRARLRRRVTGPRSPGRAASRCRCPARILPGTSSGRAHRHSEGRGTPPG